MATIKTITVNSKDYNIITITNEEFNESHRDISKSITKYSDSENNNVLIIGTDKQTDILNKTERETVLREV